MTRMKKGKKYACLLNDAKSFDLRKDAHVYTKEIVGTEADVNEVNLVNLRKKWGKI